jgi:hypothetical protein
LCKSFSAALALRNIFSAVKNFTESEDRSRNVVFGLPEEQEENLDSKVNDLSMEQLEEKLVLTDCHKIWQTQNKPGAKVSRQIQYSLSSTRFLG